MKHIVTQEWLFEHGTEEGVVIVDCRFTLGQPSSGQEAYNQEHIPGAHYMDLEKDLSSPKGRHGGRHPLPDWNELAKRLGRAGIDSRARVVAYDDQGGAMASRLWWLLTFMGHDRVYVLEGGFTKWKEAGYPVTDEPPVELEAVFKPTLRSDMVVHIEQVRESIGCPGIVLIDSREARRYEGLEEQIDPVAGHIPGAKNYFWKDSLQEDGSWKDGAAQRQRFDALGDAKEIIVYCGSGVTACPNVLALSEAGLHGVKLYAGSWSDWVSYADNPVATGRE